MLVGWPFIENSISKMFWYFVKNNFEFRYDFWSIKSISNFDTIFIYFLAFLKEISKLETVVYLRKKNVSLFFLVPIKTEQEIVFDHFFFPKTKSTLSFPNLLQFSIKGFLFFCILFFVCLDPSWHKHI